MVFTRRSSRLTIDLTRPRRHFWRYKVISLTLSIMVVSQCWLCSISQLHLILSIMEWILLSRFENVFRISWAALKWIALYLTNHSQVVVIDSEHSKPVLMKYGVPQGSVLGPKKCIVYTKPLGAIICRHGLSYLFYADDTQLYISFKSSVTLVVPRVRTSIYGKEHFSVQQPNYGMHSQLTFVNSKDCTFLRCCW